jgi:two-component system, NarL family, sensor histidine kinase BarA
VSGSDWQDPLALSVSRLLTVTEVAELVASFVPIFEGHLAVTTTKGEVMGGVVAAVQSTAWSREVFCAGEPAYRVFALGPEPVAQHVGRALHQALDLAAHHAFSREVSLATHEAAMDVNFEEVTHTNAQLARSAVRLDEVERLKTHLLANMSHELRTPLTAIIGYAEMLKDGFVGTVTAEQQECLSTILAKSDQLLGLVSSVLDVSRLGQASDNKSKQSLLNLVRSELSSLWPMVTRRGLTVDVKVSTDEMVFGSARRLRMVITCLLSNAMKFSNDNGAIEVALSFDPMAMADGALVLDVTDNGVGIPAAQLVRIFEPFFQGDPSSTRAYGGTGIGLTLAKQYVEEHGGDITVKSTIGQGTRFRVRLPVAPPLS